MGMISEKNIAGANEEGKCKLYKTIENTKIFLERVITLVFMKIYKRKEVTSYERHIHVWVLVKCLDMTLQRCSQNAVCLGRSFIA